DHHRHPARDRRHHRREHDRADREPEISAPTLARGHRQHLPRHRNRDARSIRSGADKPMSTYATAASVKDILRTNYDGCAPLAPYIKAAHSLVARMVTCAAAKGYAHTTDELESITNALAAHFYCAMD